MPIKKLINEDAVFHQEKIDRRKIKQISYISLLMGFAQAIMIYVMSSYFKQIAGTENVGSFYFVSYAITLIIYFNLHKIVKRYGKAEVFHYSIMLKVVSLVCLILNPSSYLAIILLIVYIISGNLEWVSLDAILESYSSDNKSGRIRGKYLTIMNFGYLLGPFLSTRILDNYDFQGVFLCLFLANIAILYFSLIKIKKVDHKFNGDITVKDIVNKVIKRKNILRIYYVSFILELFYALAIIYTPIYMLDLGMSWNEIGIIFTIMLLPFVFIQYPMGLLADKKFGEKEFIIGSLFLMAFSTAAIYFINSRSILVWSAVLLATRIGAAGIEVLRDSYFYKRIDGRDVDVINFFRTAMPFGYVIGSAVSALALIFFPLKSIFLIIAAVVFSALIPACFLVDNKCEKEIALEKAK
jgi:MFS family permease